MDVADYLHRTYGQDAWVSPWIESLPPDYFTDFAEVLRREYYRFDALETDAGRRNLRSQLFVRMAQCRGTFLPWLQEVVDLNGRRVLEIGAGTGSCTIPLLLEGASVRALDIDPRGLAAAEARRKYLDAPDAATFETVAPDWLERDDGFAWSSVQADLIVCYALLEHLTNRERVILLHNAMKALPVGGLLVIHETPNRLAPIDWHSSHLPFHEILPDELAQMNLARCRRRDRPTKFVRWKLDEDPGEITALYRQGRGVSFHEFDLAVGLDTFEVVQDGYALAERRPSALQNAPFEAIRAFRDGLGRMLEALGIHRGFACTSLDLILRKRAEPVRYDAR